MRSLFGLLISLGIVGALLTPGRMPAAVAASPSATPTSTPPPYSLGNHRFPTPIPLPTNRISVDGGSTWLAIDYFSPPNGQPDPSTGNNIASINGTHTEKALIAAALTNMTFPKTVLVYWSGAPWTLLGAIFYGPFSDDRMIEIGISGIIRPFPVTTVVPRFFVSPSPSPLPPGALHPVPALLPTPEPLSGRISFDDGKEWIPVDRVVFPNVPRTLPLSEAERLMVPEQLWMSQPLHAPDPSNFLVYCDGREWAFTDVVLKPYGEKPPSGVRDEIYIIQRTGESGSGGVLVSGPSPSPSGSPHGGSGSGGAPVSGHGSSGSSPVAPQSSPAASP